jgi:putative ABC transport system permease protein
MKFTEIIRSANASLLRNKARTLLTIIAIFIGATTLSLTNGIGAGIKAYLNKQVGNLGNSTTLTITAASKTNKLTASNDGLTKYDPNEKKITASEPSGRNQTQVALTQKDIDKIKQVPNIVSVEPLLTITPDYIAATTNQQNKFQFNLAQTVGSSNLDMSNGSNVDNASPENQITIPSSYVESLGFSSDASALQQSVTIAISDASGNQSVFTATIVGVQQKSLLGSTTAYANKAIFNQLYQFQITGLPQNTVDEYTAVGGVFKANLSDTQIQTIKSALSAEGYDAETVKDQVSTVFTVINSVTYVLDGFAAITLVAAAFGIVNTLYMTVQDRTKEIGLMKALGMGKRRIFLLFSTEAVLIGFWGSMLAIVFANLLGKLINSFTTKGFLKDFTGLQLLSFPAKASAIIVIGIMLIAFLAGTLPARRAARKDPIDALRYE